MTSLAVVVAMRWEARTLGSFGDAIAVVGPGAGPATAAAQRLVAAGAEGLVSWGVAAGLDPGLAPGALLLPDGVIGEDGVHRRPSAPWRARLIARLTHLQPLTGAVAETATLLGDAAAKSALRARTGAVAADMESAAVLRAAAAAGVPALVVRVVLDPAAGAVPPAWARVVDPAGRLQPAALWPLLLRPGAWPAGLALAHQRRRAARTLRRAGAALGADRTRPQRPRAAAATTPPGG